MKKLKYYTVLAEVIIGSGETQSKFYSIFAKSPQEAQKIVKSYNNVVNVKCVKRNDISKEDKEHIYRVLVQQKIDEFGYTYDIIRSLIDVIE